MRIYSVAPLSGKKQPWAHIFERGRKRGRAHIEEWEKLVA